MNNNYPEHILRVLRERNDYADSELAALRDILKNEK